MVIPLDYLLDGFNMQTGYNQYSLRILQIWEKTNKQTATVCTVQRAPYYILFVRNRFDEMISVDYESHRKLNKKE